MNIRLTLREKRKGLRNKEGGKHTPEEVSNAAGISTLTLQRWENDAGQNDEDMRVGYQGIETLAR